MYLYKYRHGMHLVRVFLKYYRLIWSLLSKHLLLISIGTLYKKKYFVCPFFCPAVDR